VQPPKPKPMTIERPRIMQRRCCRRRRCRGRTTGGNLVRPLLAILEAAAGLSGLLALVLERAILIHSVVAVFKLQHQQEQATMRTAEAS
jgi:hypothetical protein